MDSKEIAIAKALAFDTIGSDITILKINTATLNDSVKSLNATVKEVSKNVVQKDMCEVVQKQIHAELGHVVNKVEAVGISLKNDVVEIKKDFYNRQAEIEDRQNKKYKKIESRQWIILSSIILSVVFYLAGIWISNLG